MAEPGYTDTILIDANRQASEEYKGDNYTQNSIYTNKTGSGVKLNQGDKISIHSGYISKRGAGSETMEFTGKPTNKTYTIRQLTKTSTQKAINPASYRGLNLPRDNFAQISEEAGCEQYTYDDVEYDVKDNEVNFNISFYKTTNGEGYYHLPRRFDAYKSQFWVDTESVANGMFGPVIRQEWAGLLTEWSDAAKPWINGQEASVGDEAGDGSVRALEDSWLNGMSYGAHFTGAVTPPTQAVLPNQVNNYKFAYSNQNRRCLADMYFYQRGYANSASTGGNTGAGGGDPGVAEWDRFSFVWKKKNDNSRYTIYAKELSYFGGVMPRKWFIPTTTQLGEVSYADEANTRNLTASRDDYADTTQTTIYLEKRDPAVSEYIKYTETKNLKLEPGDYSPANVAAELTDQLNKTDEPKFVVGAVARRGFPSTTGQAAVNPVDDIQYDTNENFSKQIITSCFTDATCYKTFNTATSTSVEAKMWEDFISENPVVTTRAGFHLSTSTSSINYLSSYQFIGVKRPELFEAGRKVAKELGYRVVGNDDGTGHEMYNAEFDFAEMKPARLLVDVNYPEGRLITASRYHGNATTGIGCSWKRMVSPWIVKGIAFANRASAEVYTSYPWTQENLDGLKEYFDVQGKYPELFEGISVNSTSDPALPIYLKGYTNENTRFFHMGGQEGAYTGDETHRNQLGTDFYNYDDIRTAETKEQSGSNAFFFYHDEIRKDVANGGKTDNDLYYGMFLKRTFVNPYDGLEEYCIAVSTRLIGGIQTIHFDGVNELSPVHNRTIGCDIHFCGYGTSCINLYAGYLSQQLKEEAPTHDAPAGYPMISGSHAVPGRMSASGYPIGATPIDINGKMPSEQAFMPANQSHAYQNTAPLHQFLKKRYIGAENPQIAFDTNESKFNFSKLHTPERVGNIINAGSTASNPIVPDTNDEVYYLNKRLLKKEFCPDMFPYSQLVPSNTTETTGGGSASNPTAELGNPGSTTYSTYWNENLTPWSIMDADSGIFLEDFGISSKSDWRSSLWFMLGFTYDQFNVPSNEQQLTRQTRINNIITTDTIGKPTTNANVEPADFSQYTTNIFGAELRTTQIPTVVANWFIDSAGTYDDNQSRDTYMPGATITQTSAQINAERLPIKMRHPYYLIKSDIIADTNYLGSEDSGQSLPIIAVVSKGSADGDFFFTGEGQNDFTITNSKVITEIRTQILNPDGSTAKLNEDTSIIYKIIKENNSSLNVMEEMMAQQQKGKKK